MLMFTHTAMHLTPSQAKPTHAVLVCATSHDDAISDCVSAIFNVFYFFGVVGPFVASQVRTTKPQLGFFCTASRASICIFLAALLVSDTRLYFSAIRTLCWSTVAFRLTPNIRALTSLCPRSDLLSVEAAVFCFFFKESYSFSFEFRKAGEYRPN